MSRFVQPDLFADAGADADSEDGDQVTWTDNPDEVEETRARIRAELTALLDRVRGADKLPWRNLTSATLGEMHFHSMAKYLRKDEAGPLREAFGKEMTRLWDACGS